ncbi:MAG: AsmA family protein [Gammaproteobacteria bacterium]
MKRLLKWLLGLAALLLIVVLAVVVAVATLDPNEHKDWIADQFEKRTGRTLSLQGDLSLTYYPWLGVEVADVTMGNAAGFGDEPFFHTDYANFRIKLIPMLQGRYEIDTVHIHGLVVNLAVDKDGRSNWADLAGEEPAERRQLPLAAVVLGGVDIQNASFSYHDRAAGARHVIRNLNAATGELTYGDPIDLNLSLEAESTAPELAADLNLTGTLNYDLDGKRYEIKPLRLTSNIRSDRLPGGQARMEMNTVVNVDMKADSIRISDLDVNALGTSVKGELEAGRISTPAPSVAGRLDVKGEDLSLPFRLLEVEPLASQLAALPDKSITLNTRVDMDMQRGDVNVPELKARLLGATIEGFLKARNIQSQTPAVEGELSAAGPDLPTLMQVVGQVQGGKEAPLAVYGRKLRSLPERAFSVKTAFNADMKSGDINVPDLDIDTLGIKLTGNLKARNMQDAGGTMQGNLSLRSGQPGALLTALDQPDLGAVMQSLALDAGVGGSRTDLNLKPLSLRMRLAGKDIPDSPVDVTLNAASRFNLEKGQLDVDDFTLNGLGLDVKGRISARDIQEAPAFSGRVTVAPFNLRRLMGQLNMEPPETANKQVLRKVAVSTDFDGSTKHINLENLALTLDETSLSGKAGITDLEKRALRADINIDRINLDDYLPPEAEDKPATPETAAGAAAQLPVETLRAIDAVVDLKAGALTVSKINLTDVILRLEGKDGVIKLDPLSANLYQGTYSGRINLNAKGKTPKLTVTSKLDGVQMEPLLLDFSDTGEAQLHGRSFIDLNLNTSGDNTDIMKKSLNGKIDLRVEDGVLVGVDVRKVLEQAEIILESKRIGKIDRGERTPFDRLTATLNVKSGVIDNNDLVILSPGFRITGKGMVANLNNDTIKYDMMVDVIEETTEREEQRYNIGGYSIALQCRGNMNMPDCRPDYGSLLKEALRKGGSEKIKEALEKALGGGRQQQPADTTQQQAQPKQEQEQAPQEQEPQKKDPQKELEDKLKEGLKGLFQ